MMNSSNVIPRSEFLERQDRAREACAGRGWDALLLIGRAFYDRPGNLAYYANHFPPFPTTVVTGRRRGLGHGALLLPAWGPSVLLVDGPNYREDLVVADEVRVSNDLPAGLAQVLKDQGLTTAAVGLAGEDILPVGLFRELATAVPGVAWHGADDLVARQRRVKSVAEQALLRRAAQVAEVGLRAALDATREGVTEIEVCATGTAAALRAGADFVRYLRVHSGPWSAWRSRWPQATNRALAAGELVTLDIIGACQGYQFDVLRTTVVGEASPEQVALCDAVLKALERLIGACRPGALVDDLVRQTLGVLEDAGYGAHAAAFVGHGIGLETVEEPILAPGEMTRLEPGMALCVEPGVYIPGWGGCSLEEELIVGDDEPEVLTDVPHQLW
jgi:Xaa-Pro aminopeptidase